MINANGEPTKEAWDGLIVWRSLGSGRSQGAPRSRGHDPTDAALEETTHGKWDLAAICPVILCTRRLRSGGDDDPTGSAIQEPSSLFCARLAGLQRRCLGATGKQARFEQAHPAGAPPLRKFLTLARSHVGGGGVGWVQKGAEGGQHSRFFLGRPVAWGSGPSRVGRGGGSAVVPQRLSLLLVHYTYTTHTCTKYKSTHEHRSIE